MVVVQQDHRERDDDREQRSRFERIEPAQVQLGAGRPGEEDDRNETHQLGDAGAREQVGRTLPAVRVHRRIFSRLYRVPGKAQNL